MYGRNTINAVTGPSNWAQAGSAMGVALRTKNPDVKETAMSAAITGIFSITEPAIYGVNLKYKKPSTSPLWQAVSQAASQVPATLLHWQAAPLAS